MLHLKLDFPHVFKDASCVVPTLCPLEQSELHIVERQEQDLLGLLIDEAQGKPLDIYSECQFLALPLLQNSLEVFGLDLR